MFFIEAPRELAEEVRRSALDRGVLDTGHIINETGTSVLLPVLEREAALSFIDLHRFDDCKVVERGDSPVRSLDPTPIELVLDQPSLKKLPTEILSLVPRKWERYGDVVLLKLDQEVMAHSTEIAEAFAGAFGLKAVLLDKGIRGRLREPEVEFLLGDDASTVHKENGIRYSFDPSKVMFSSGNVDERIRMASAASAGEQVVDMFAGIGYFTLPIAVHCGARVEAFELNPVSCGYLKENVRINDVEHLVKVQNADNLTAPEGAADRILMGYIDTDDRFLEKAFRLLKPEGGVIHYHNTFPEDQLPEVAIERIKPISERHGRSFTYQWHSIKSYAPGIVHAVLDLTLR